MNRPLCRGLRLRGGFTLVELLVVIGIIALLISVLLPSLNKARQAANQLDCEARLQQMGSALQIYLTQSKGLLPYGYINHTAAWTDNALPNATNPEGFTWWFYTLSEILNKNIQGADGLVRNLSPIFRDRDTIEPGQEPRWVIHYTCNPRLLYRADIPDPAPRVFFGAPELDPAKGEISQRKITSVRRGSTIFVIWDAPQLLDQAANAYPIAEALDAWGWYNTSALCLDTPQTGFTIDRAVLPGQFGVTGRQPGKAFQIKYNFDAQVAFGASGWLSHLRFRHMNNTKLCALCLDGHCETRRVGDVKVQDIFTNYK